jgi:mannose-6-phosphate isomerase-like protein (cupin superfamily)
MSQQARVTVAKIEQENLPSQESWKSTRLLSVNGNNVKLRAMRNTEAPWHRHDDSDELFIVQTGTITMDVRDQAGKVSSYPLAPGQLLVVHRGTEHRARCSGSATLIVIDAFA